MYNDPSWQLTEGSVDGALAVEGHDQQPAGDVEVGGELQLGQRDAGLQPVVGQARPATHTPRHATSRLVTVMSVRITIVM